MSKSIKLGIGMPFRSEILMRIIYNMIIYRTQFKYSLWFTKRAEETARAYGLVSYLCYKKCDDFWRSIKRCKPAHAIIIDNVR